MSSMTPLTTSKLKEQLTSLRESISALDASSPSISGYAVLLTIELASRDVHYALTPSLVSDADIASLFDAVNNTAGKSAIGKDVYPQQLMAALYAAGGMSASALTTCSKNAVSSTVREACTKAMKRCKEVNDGRFYTLLKLLSSDVSNATSFLTDIAYAYYLYGAENYAIDQMPMWKRCFDCALGGEEDHRSCSNPKAIGPLKNMMRIAESKGNVKRVAELRVWLVCGYIGAIQGRIQSDSDERKEESVFEKMSMQQFVDVFFSRKTSLTKLESTSVEMLLELAEECLAACDKPLDAGSDESKLLYYYLETEIHHLTEEVNIFGEVQQLVRAKKNRLPEKEVKAGKGGKSTPATSKTTSIEVTAADKADMYNQTRRKVLLEAWSSWYDSKHDRFAPSGLRDAIKSCSASSNLLHDCQEVLRCQIQRLVDVAIALQQKRNVTKKGKISVDALRSCWGEVLSFVYPLMVGYLSNAIKQCDETVSVEASLERLLEFAAQSVVSMAWMCEPLKFMSDERFQDMALLLSVAHDCLTICKKERGRQDKQAPSNTSQKKSAFLSDDGPGEKNTDILLLNCSLAATTANMNVLSGNQGTNEISVDTLTAIAHKATSAALTELKTSSGSHQSTNGMFGAPYLQFASAWSGLYLNPWPFCNLAQGRAILRNARASIFQANKIWGREAGHSVESLTLDIAEADLESGVTGGFVDNAQQLYESALDYIESNESRSADNRALQLLKVHCLLGLARMSLTKDTMQSEGYGRSALDALIQMNDKASAENKTYALICVHAWDDPSMFRFTSSYHESASRQLVAEALARSSRLEEAQSFLHDAIKVAPSNFDAVFALAAFQLRKVLSQKDDLDSLKKGAKTSLLKSAKLDKNSPFPFALLGVFYELENDTARAIGCHKKALSIDPSNPISGRGLRRLVSTEDMEPFCEFAMKVPSSINGWAWRILGQLRYTNGDHESAVICFQQALRCRDVHDPEREVLGLFYTDPKGSSVGIEERYCEAGDTWCELGSCYRDMGKWSGSHRAFDAAHAISDGNLSPNSLVAWAQVALELGLYDESIERCDNAIASCQQSQVQRLANYVKGNAVLAVSRQDLQEGKYGACLAHIKLGKELKAESYSELKLLGDLLSVSEALPPYVFTEDDTHFGVEKLDIVNVEVKRKLRVLSAGADSYSKALELVKEIHDVDGEEKQFLVAAAATDLGCNLLAQVRTVSLALGDGSGGDTRTSVTDLKVQHEQLQNIIQEAINAFICAIDSSPGEALAWCGIGCALAAIDPMKAQHAFARALELDKGGGEAWSNMGVLFAHYNCRDKGSEVLDALTQAEDTPLMWICRGLFFESASEVWNEQVSAREANLSKAADAYRAALQISQHPSAILGLSLTCRRNDLESLRANDIMYSTLASEASSGEGRLNMSIHASIAGGGNYFANYVSDFMQMESLFNQATACDSDDESARDALQLVDLLIDSVKESKTAMNAPHESAQSMSEHVQCEIDCSSATSLKEKASLGNIPSSIVDEAIAKVTTVTTNPASNFDGVEQQSSLENARNAAHLNPDSGEKWLAYAKELAREVAVEKSTCTQQTLASAKTAASRAYDILHNSAIHASMISPTTRSGAEGTASVDRSKNRVVSRVASADIVSDALSLLAWLNDLEKLHTDEEHSDFVDTTSMQEAFLLDPTNSLCTRLLMMHQ